MVEIPRETVLGVMCSFGRASLLCFLAELLCACPLVSQFAVELINFKDYVAPEFFNLQGEIFTILTFLITHISCVD